MPDGDHFLMRDPATGDVLRLSASDGRLVWRQEIGEPRRPARRRRRRGAPRRPVRQALRARPKQRRDPRPCGLRPAAPHPPPPWDATPSRSMSWANTPASTHSPVKTFHASGSTTSGTRRVSVVTPPTFVLNKLVIAENTGISTSRVHVLAADSKGALAIEVGDTRLDGLVVTAPAVDGRRIAVVSTTGAVRVFDVSTSDDEGSVSLVASRDPESGPPVGPLRAHRRGQRLDRRRPALEAGYRRHRKPIAGAGRRRRSLRRHFRRPPATVGPGHHPHSAPEG